MFVIVNKTAINLDNVEMVWWVNFNGVDQLHIDFIRGDTMTLEGEKAAYLWSIVEDLATKLLREL